MTVGHVDYAQATPTKMFFVNMLTRDITLGDAILDLVDNCLDGALRMANGNEVDYSRHWVNVTLNPDTFSIEDNCGGIPRDIAINYAFKTGREPDDDRDSDTETIGMYGVGMKRAIFKMGREAEVLSDTGNDGFSVTIGSEWLQQKEWNPLPMVDVVPGSTLGQPGTRITVQALYPGVSRHFESSAFTNELETAISEHFTIFLQRGLVVSVNEKRIDPVLVRVLATDSADGPAPFVFRKTIDDVDVSIVVGLNTGRGLADDDDDVIEFELDRSSATAGWTVFCNDRAVIVGDKGRLTGWGDGVPLYHYQFSIITGIIEFRSKRADKLPITTTKRALDTSSDIWLQSLVKMKEGLRIWITYTNNWKNHPRADQTQHWVTAKPLALKDAVRTIATTRPDASRPDGTVEFNPQKKGVMPVPPQHTPSSRRMVFSRPIAEIEAVSTFFFDTPNEKPSIVGETCFEAVLENLPGAGQ